MIGEIIGAIGSIVNMINSSSSGEKTQEEIDALRKKNTIPPALLQALGMAGEQATRGLAGYETMQEDTKSELPTTLNQIRDMAGSGALTDVLTQLYTKQNKSLRDLSISNEQAKMANKKNLQDLLSGDMARAQNTQLSTDMSLALSQIAGRQQGKKDQMAYISELLGAVGGVANSDWSDIIAGFSKQNKTNPLGDIKYDTYTGDIG